jgi:hypothetical protein
VLLTSFSGLAARLAEDFFAGFNTAFMSEAPKNKF